jgi:hypothetical protein
MQRSSEGHSADQAATAQSMPKGTPSTGMDRSDIAAVYDSSAEHSD